MLNDRTIVSLLYPGEVWGRENRSPGQVKSLMKWAKGLPEYPVFQDSKMDFIRKHYNSVDYMKRLYRLINREPEADKVLQLIVNVIANSRGMNKMERKVYLGETLYLRLINKRVKVDSIISQSIARVMTLDGAYVDNVSINVLEPLISETVQVGDFITVSSTSETMIVTAIDYLYNRAVVMPHSNVGQLSVQCLSLSPTKFLNRSQETLKVDHIYEVTLDSDKTLKFMVVAIVDGQAKAITNDLKSLSIPVMVDSNTTFIREELVKNIKEVK